MYSYMNYGKGPASHSSKVDINFLIRLNKLYGFFKDDEFIEKIINKKYNLKNKEK